MAHHEYSGGTAPSTPPSNTPLLRFPPPLPIPLWARPIIAVL